jgi:curved DNA-binding protein CbpA
LNSNTLAMTGPDRTHYQTLGISSHASAAEVRAAYIAKMKLHHPDVAFLGSQGPCPEDINTAYAVLRDQFRRRAYDATLTQRVHQRQYTRAGARPTRVRAQPKHSRALKRRGRRFAAMAMAAAAVATWSAITTSSGIATASSPRKIEKQGFMGPPEPVLDPVQNSDVKDALSDFEWIVTTSEAREVAIYSRHCFSQLSNGADLRLLDRCVAFDLAAGYLLPADASVSPLYTKQNRDARYRKASAFLTPKAATARVLELEEKMISAIASSMKQTSSAEYY